MIHILGTFLLVDFTCIFFRANDLEDAIFIITSMLTIKNPWILFDGSLYTCGLDENNFRLMLLGIGILVFADFCKLKQIKIREVIMKQDYWFRYLFIAVVILVLLIFGKYGPTYEAANFIYFQF